MQQLVLHPLPFGKISACPIPLIGYAALEQGVLDSPVILELRQYSEDDFDSFAFIPLGSGAIESYHLNIKLTDGAEYREHGEIWGITERISGDELPYHANLLRSDGGYQILEAQKEEGAVANFFETLTHELLPHLANLPDFFRDVKPTASNNVLLEFSRILYPDIAEPPFGGIFFAAVFGKLTQSHDNYKIDDFDMLIRNDEEVTCVGVKACVEGAFCGKLVVPLDGSATFWEEWTYPGIDAGTPEADLPPELQEAIGLIRQHFEKA